MLFSFGDSTCVRGGVLSKRALQTPVVFCVWRLSEHFGDGSGCNGREDELPEEIVES